MRRNDGTGHSPFEPIHLGWTDGLQAVLIPFGARLCSLRVPGRQGPVDVVLTYGSPAQFREDRQFMGCIVGRTCNRIANARFVVDGTTYSVTRNEGPHHLHGGTGGFHARSWNVLTVEKGARQRVVFGYEAADGEEGYPGAVEVRASFELEVATLRVTLEARTDRATPVAMTFHPYFNLSGAPDRTIHDHELLIAAHEILPVAESMIPTGDRMLVHGTPFDFRRPAVVGERLGMSHPQLGIAGGFDHSFVLDPSAPFAAELSARASGVKMRLYTNQAGLQLYTANRLEGAGQAWGRQCGVCLEPQSFPNAVNDPRFPSPLLRPGAVYRNEIRYEFSLAAL